MMRLHFAMLRQFLELLYTVLTKINDTYESLAALDRLFDGSEGHLIDTVREKRDNLLGILNHCHERYTELADLLDRFLQALSKEVNPINRDEYVVIDIESRETALRHIENIVNDIYNKIIHIQCNSFPQTVLDEETEARNQRKIQHNADRVDAIREECSAIHAQLGAKLQDLKEAYEPYQNAKKIDEEYAAEAQVLYNKYVSPAEQARIQRAEKSFTFNNTCITFEKTVIDGVVDIGQGIWSGMKTIGAGAVMGWNEFTNPGAENPEWVTAQLDRHDDFVAGMGDVAEDLWNHPIKTVKRMGDGIGGGVNDVYREEGGWVAGATVAGMLIDPFKGVGKAGKVSKSYKALKTGKKLVVSVNEVRNAKARVKMGKMDEYFRKMRESAGGVEGAGNGKPRTFTSPDKHVGEAATAIDAKFPGRVVDVNKDVVKDGRIVGEFDIELDTVVIQVKQDKARDLIGQMMNKTSPNTTKTVIGYAPDLVAARGLKGAEAFIAAAEKEGLEIFTREEDLLKFLEAH